VSDELYEGLSADQVGAASGFYRWYADEPTQEYFVNGEAGTGKTTIATQMVRKLGLRTCVAAYTGKAASVLRKKGLSQASTIHSLIYEPLPGSNPVQFIRAPLSPLADARLLVLDECSMCDLEIANDLRAYGKKILVLGDLEQLPPIRGQGAFTNRPPDYTLTEVHRQALGSPVLQLAGQARRGEALVAPDDDRARIIRLGRAAILEGARMGQVICGTHRSRWGATRLIREERGFSGISPEPGERIICRHNDRESGLYNGMLGVVEEVYDLDEMWSMRVRMDDLDGALDVLVDPTLFREHEYAQRGEPPRYRRGVQLFDFGYVITCHSAQGSEWPEVTIIDDSGSFRDEASRWLYTAITRASERVTLLRR
jgi:exodeoxyribonuclease-5